VDLPVRDSVGVADGGIAQERPGACRILDRGAKVLNRYAVAEIVRSIAAGEMPEIARDRNAICYRAVLVGRGGVPGVVIVKTPRLGPQRTNADATFAGEAAMLLRLPAEGIAGVPELVARVAANGTHFLFMSELPGRHPHPRKHPLDGPQLHAILDALYAMDRRGFMHYDLKPANILTDGAHVALIDFEFARAGAPWDAETPAEAAYCEDFNVANNPFVRARSNVANFEFRCMHRYLVDVEGFAARAAESLLRTWLIAKASYHARMARCLSDRAAVHELRLARLLADPADAMMRVERRLMAFRTAVFERDARGAARSRAAIRAAIDEHRCRRRAMPKWYADAVMRVVELVGRSVHPTT
jgi:predicted Ser/Thr protein kinase